MVRVLHLANSLATDAVLWAGDDGAGVKLNLNATSFSTRPLPPTCSPVHRNQPFSIFSPEASMTYGFAFVLLDLITVVVIIRVLRFILKPLRQPRIISELIGGIIMGPSLLGRNQKFNRNVLPESSIIVIRNLGKMGFMLFFFIAGVKLDLSVIKRIARRKHVYIAIGGAVAPLVLSATVGFHLLHGAEAGLARFTLIGIVATSLATTYFPVIHVVLKEFDVLNSEVGRFAMCVAILSDAIGMNAYLIIGAMAQGDTVPNATIWYIISALVMAAFVATVLRWTMQWIVDITPEGEPVDQNYVVAILIGVMMMGFLTDMLGMGIASGPIWIGLVIPDGPPLGATLVERCETIVMEIFMPLSFAMVGLYTDVFEMSEVGWSRLSPFALMIIVGYLSKMVATTATAFLLKTPLRESVALGLVMNLRGQIEVSLYVFWMERKMIGIPAFTVLVLLTVVNTAISAPLVTLVYDTTRPYMVNKRRTIQHTPPWTELGIVLSIPDHETIGSLISLVEHSFTACSNPLAIFALHLVSIAGRSAPTFLENEDGDNNKFSSKFPGHETIQRALTLFRKSRSDCVRVRKFTAVAPKRTMYRDICELALAEKTALIILPFHKHRLDDILGVESSEQALRAVNCDVLAHAPCSVAILYDRGGLCQPFVAARTSDQQHHQKTHQFVVLFLGGADCREALHFANKMACNPEVNLTVVRFLPSSSEKEDEIEKKLDDGVLTWFWVKNEANERVLYREIVVNSGADTLAVIHAMSENAYDLWITGRKQGINPQLLEGLSTWSNDDEELGVIGDNLVSSDFFRNTSLIIIQQQIQRGQKKAANMCCKGLKEN